MVKLILEGIESGNLVIKSSSFNIIPQTISEVFLLKLNLIFPTQSSFSIAREIFSVCLATLKPLTLRIIFNCISSLQVDSTLNWDDFFQAYSQISEFLPLNTDQTVTFFHNSFRDFLLGSRSCDHNKFVIDVKLGHSALAFYYSRCKGQLDPSETLDLAHHILKANLFNNKARDHQSIWLSIVSEKATLALASSKNVAFPNIMVSKLLLFAKANVDYVSQDEFQVPLICQFISNGHTEMAFVLSEFNVDLLASDSKGITPLMLASEKANLPLMKMILEKRPTSVVQTCNEGQTALEFAIKSGEMEAIEMLSNPKIWPSKKKFESASLSALLFSIKSSQMKAMKVFLCNTDFKEEALIVQTAILSGNVETCKFVLSKFRLDSVANPLHLAIDKGHSQLAKYLIEENLVDLKAKDKNLRNAFHIAARNGENKTLEYLLNKEKSLIDEPDGSEGLTPLSWACVKSQESSVEVLLSKGANIELVDFQKRSALHHAAIVGNVNIAKLILDFKGQNDVIEKADKNGIRPIDQAICYGHRDLVMLLLKKGAKLGPTTWTMAKGKPILL